MKDVSNKNPSKTAQPGKYLTFILKDQRFGVYVSDVQGINKLTSITPVPGVPPYLLGVTTHSGKVIPVVDLRQKFGIEKSGHSRENCLVVIEGVGGRIGFIVDSISEVIQFNSNQIENMPVMGNHFKQAFLLGVGKLGEQIVLLIDIVEVLSQVNQLETLKEELQKTDVQVAA